MATRRARRNPSLPSAPPKRRFSGGPTASTKQERSALARVRSLAGSVNERDRPFNPERPGSWRGSSRDLVVNGGPRMHEGSALALRLSDGRNWDDAPDRSWYRETVERPQTSGALPVGTRKIRGEIYVVFMNTYQGDRRVYYYAQLESDVGSMVANGAPRLTSGYAYEFQGTSSTSWRGSSDEDWDTVMIGDEEIEAASYVGERRIDGSKCAVFQMPDDVTFYAQMSHMTRNSEVDPRDIPAHLRKAEINEIPDHNGQDIRYSQGYSSKQEPGWYQVEYATGSDYSGGSVNESNYQVLGELLEEHHPEDAQPVVWARTSGGHGTYGIVVRYGDLEDEVREAIDALEDYPLMDEEHHSELEMKQQNEAWDDWARKDFIKAVAKLEGKEWTALEDAITPDQWYSVFHAMMESANANWEDQQGAGQWIDVEKLAEELTPFIESGEFPKYSSDHDDDALQALYDALPSVDEE